MNKEPKHQKYYQGMYNLQILENEDLEKENDRLKESNFLLSCAVALLSLMLVAVIWVG